MRLPWQAVGGGALVLALGAAGLVRGAVPQSAATDAQPAGDPVTVYGAYVRPAVPPTPRASAYFTVRNNTDRPDRLESVVSGAGAESTLHADQGGRMVALATGAEVPAHGRLVFSVGKRHVMIEKLFGPLRGGQTVNFQLTFRDAGTVDVTAPVVPFGSPLPSGASR